MWFSSLKYFPLDVKSNFLVFKTHMCLLSSVAFRLVRLVKETLWLLYLVLKVVSVRPTYVCFGSPSFVVANLMHYRVS